MREKIINKEGMSRNCEGVAVAIQSKTIYRKTSQILSPGVKG